MSSFKNASSVFAAAVVGLIGYSLVVQPSVPVLAQQSDSAQTDMKPVETDMHEYMEYIHQPTYRKLRDVMKKAPEDDKGWLDIKSGALILSESGNLILLRGPKKDREDWNAHAIAIREAGAKLYRAAHDQEFQQATTHYQAMIQKCNSCHQQFAGGEHQLKP